MAANSRMFVPAPATTDQYNFCCAIDAMRRDPAWQTREPIWLVAHPGDLARIWQEVPYHICGLRVVEILTCPSDVFYLASVEDFQTMLPQRSEVRL